MKFYVCYMYILLYICIYIIMCSVNNKKNKNLLFDEHLEEKMAMG
jgi:hypothetical protein